MESVSTTYISRHISARLSCHASNAQGRLIMVVGLLVSAKQAIVVLGLSFSAERATVVLGLQTCTHQYLEGQYAHTAQQNDVQRNIYAGMLYSSCHAIGLNDNGARSMGFGRASDSGAWSADLHTPACAWKANMSKHQKTMMYSATFTSACCIAHVMQAMHWAK
jgi:hypothetical protein